MNSKQSNPIHINEWADNSQNIQSLQRRLRQSLQRLQAVQQTLPVPLANIKAGGFYPETGHWVILAQNSAQASKLRHFIPTMLKNLATADLHTTDITIKITS